MGVDSHRYIPAGRRFSCAETGSGAGGSGWIPVAIIAGLGILPGGCSVTRCQIRNDVYGMNALIARFFLERDRLSRLEGFVALNLNGRKVREQIVAAAIFNDEAVSLGVVEPLDLAPRHDELPRPFAVSFIIGVFFC